MFLYDILEVIYSPIKAFREILTNPRYIGPVLIIIISLLLTMGTQYVSVTKHYVEAIDPSAPRDIWTNTTTPSSLWTTNAASENLTAVSNGNNDLLAGNYSVGALVSDNDTIWLKTTNIGTINCSDPSGFRTFYYKLMYAGFNQTQAPQNASSATLRMFSYNNESRYFEFNLQSSPTYLNKSQAWIDANVTLSGWNNVGGASWSNITGFEFRINLPANGQLSLYLNDLYFGGKYELLYSAVGLSYWLSSTLISSAFDIFLRWLIFAGLLWLTNKVFHAEGSPFRTMLIVVGYTFAIMFVYVPINALSISQLPLLYFPNKVVFPLTGREIAVSASVTDSIYTTYWTPTLPYNFYIGVWYATHIWTISLFAIALRILQNFSWKKALLAGLIAYIMGLFVRAIIPF